MGPFGRKKQKEEENPVVIALRALGEEDYTTRSHARQEIAKCGLEALPVLVQLIEDRSDEAQWAMAQKSLDGLDYTTRAAIEELILKYNSGIPERQREANKGLKKLPRKAREAIIQMAELKNAVEKCERRRKECIYVLGEIARASIWLDEVTPILTKLLKDRNSYIRTAAKETLAKID